MFRSLTNTLFLSRGTLQRLQNRRSYLSDAYKCTEAWNNRLNAPYLKQIRLEDLYNELDKTFVHQSPVSAIDIDIFANAIKNADYLDELRDILYKLRLTKETSNTLDSTHYATIRNFLDHGRSKDVLDVIDDRLNYGIYLDDFTANMLLDEFIKTQDYASAARTASFIMLQENFQNQITKYLSLYSCFKNVRTYKPEIKQEEVKEEKAEVKPAGRRKKQEEEIKIRVRFLRNPFFDDHFDLRDEKALTGKTLSMICSEHNDPLHNNCQLLGWVLYNKYDKAQKLAEQLKSSKTLYKETVRILNGFLELNFVKDNSEVGKSCQQLIGSLEGAATLDNDMDKEIEKLVQQAVDKYQEEEVQRHCNIFSEWEKVRETKLDEQLNRLAAEKLEKERKTREDTLKDLDEKLWFFDNEEQVDLKIESKKVIYPKRWFGKKLKPRAVDEGYIPPEVKQRRN